MCTLVVTWIWRPELYSHIEARLRRQLTNQCLFLRGVRFGWIQINTSRLLLELQGQRNSSFNFVYAKNQHGNMWLAESEVRVPKYRRVTALRPRSTDSCEAKMNTWTKLLHWWSRDEGNGKGSQKNAPMFVEQGLRRREEQSSGLSADSRRMINDEAANARVRWTPRKLSH